MAGKKTQDTAEAPQVSIEERLMHLRGEIRKQIKSGMQTHEAQDAAMNLLRLVDDLDLDLKQREG